MAIGRDKVERIVAAANQAPSGDNCQPWAFRWRAPTLEILHDAGRARHALNHEDHGSFLTLGCVLESIALAAGAEGLSAQAEPSPGAPDGAPWAVVRLSEGGAPAPVDELAGMLHRRCSDRRLYDGGSLAHPVFAATARDAARFPGVGVHVLGKPSDELTRYFVAADAFSFRQEEVFLDIMRWVRFNRAEVERTRDGVPWCSLGPPLPPVPFGGLARSRLMQKLVDRTGSFAVWSQWTRAQLASSAALILLSVPTPEREALVSVGQVALRLWLRLNQAGFGVQPSSVVSTTVYAAATRGLPAETRPEFVDLFRSGRGILARAFSLPEGALPVWLLRTGVSSPLPAPLRALRLPLDAIFTAEAAR